MVQLVKVSFPGLSRAEQPGFESLSEYQRFVSSALNLVTYQVASVFILRVLGICIMTLAYWPRAYWLYLEGQKNKKDSPLLQKYIFRRQPCFFG